MEWIVVLLAGGAIGIWHERDKARAARKAFRDGEAFARKRQQTYRVYASKPREAIPVPGYETGRVVPSYIRKAQAVMVAGTVREPKATSDSKCLHLQSVAEAGAACHGRYGRVQ